jgi:hypothetical protein
MCGTWSTPRGAAIWALRPAHPLPLRPPVRGIHSSRSHRPPASPLTDPGPAVARSQARSPATLRSSNPASLLSAPGIGPILFLLRHPRTSPRAAKGGSWFRAESRQRQRGVPRAGTPLFPPRITFAFCECHRSLRTTFVQLAPQRSCSRAISLFGRPAAP